MSVIIISHSPQEILELHLEYSYYNGLQPFWSSP